MKILASLLCAMLLVGCNATTGADVSLKTTAPKIPELAEKAEPRKDGLPGGEEIENAFMMHLPMMCAKSEQFMKRLVALGEEPLVIWRTMDANQKDILQMLFANRKNKQISVLGFVNVPDGTQIACMMSSGFDTEFYFEAIKKYKDTPKVRGENEPTKDHQKGSYHPVTW